MNITDAFAEAMMTDVPDNMSPYEAAKDCFDDAIEYVEGLEAEVGRLNGLVALDTKIIAGKSREIKQLLARVAGLEADNDNQRKLLDLQDIQMKECKSENEKLNEQLDDIRHQYFS